MIQLLTENVGNVKSKSIYQMMLEAGYSESMAKQQTHALSSEGIKRKLKSVVALLRKKRQEAIEQITNIKLTKSSAKDLTDIVDKLTKNIQLLGGKPTERLSMDLTDEQKGKIAKRIIERGR